MRFLSIWKCHDGWTSSYASGMIYAWSLSFYGTLPHPTPDMLFLFFLKGNITWLLCQVFQEEIDFIYPFSFLNRQGSTSLDNELSRDIFRVRRQIHFPNSCWHIVSFLLVFYQSTGPHLIFPHFKSMAISI